MNRRKFIENSAMAGSGLALIGSTSCTTSDHTDKKVKIQSIVEGVDYINTEDRIQRIEKAAQLMQQHQIHCIFIESGTSLEYFTGIKWWPSERLTGVLIFSDGTLQYIGPAFEKERLEEMITLEGDVSSWEEHENPFELVAQLFKAKSGATATLGIEENVRFFQSDGISSYLGQATLINAKPITAGCRAIKTTKELALMKKANEITLEAYRIGFSKLKEGMSQYDLSAIVAEASTALGATEAGWAGAMFGEYTAFPHGSKTVQQLKEGDMVLIDGGCKLGGYQADITRTTTFGKPTQRQQDIWNIVKEAQTAVYEKAKAGVPCELLDATARAVVDKYGFGNGYENFFHRVGHGIGMDFHEWEYLVKGNTTPMQPGMCFSNEPGIYLYGELGVRLEDCFYITENGYEAFTPQSPSIENPI
ncbi:MAG: Xaa-Pro peptidase family protein [Reichenbachiella sp.]|uniref:M24 family metallopeptidase n=1 Tax=Reichenbachiella sp. TaxID=2184521 RepID=UPI00296615FB|nr:Xaa-Pro peptidase family protein [Reichenbachiella sp.]MDW3210754.1 Xaa-Pro peptidase family protein [Reichenbachiella sp.]